MGGGMGNPDALSSNSLKLPDDQFGGNRVTLAGEEEMPADRLVLRSTNGSHTLCRWITHDQPPHHRARRSLNAVDGKLSRSSNNTFHLHIVTVQEVQGIH